jgi:hypothetical protein
MPKFSIKHLMIATSLISVGCYLLWYAFAHPTLHVGASTDWLMVLAWLGGGAFIMAGLFAPFRRARIGFCVGLAIQFLLPFAVSVCHLQ